MRYVYCDKITPYIDKKTKMKYKMGDYDMGDTINQADILAEMTALPTSAPAPGAAPASGIASASAPGAAPASGIASASGVTQTAASRMTASPTLETPVVPELIVPASTPAAPIQPAEPKPAEIPRMQFTPEEQQAIEAFKQKINVEDTNQIIAYGADAQKKMSEFSDSALANVRTKDLGDIGNMIGGLVVELKSFDEEESKGLFGIFKKGKNKVEDLKTKYDKVEVNVDKISHVLQDHQVVLTKDVVMLENLYKLNIVNFRQLSMYIEAGKQILEECKTGRLQELLQNAKQSGLPEDAQKANDYQDHIKRFERRIYDLELTRTISLQMAPQIRLVQNNDTVMIERIQTTILNTIPLWKNQMVISLGLAHSEQAMQAQNAVNNMTNQLLLKNAEKLKTGTIAVAQEAERGIVDIETLQQTNQSLIDTLDEVKRIQTEGSAKRAQAQIELERMENQLKEKLIQINA